MDVFTPEQEIAIKEYLLQKMNGSTGISYIQIPPNIPFDVPPGHILHGKMLPYRAIKDDAGNIYINTPSKDEKKGAFGAVTFGEVIFSANPNLPVGTECAFKMQKTNPQKEEQFLRDVDMYYGSSRFDIDGVHTFCTIMFKAPGMSMDEVAGSWDDEENNAPPLPQASPKVEVKAQQPQQQKQDEPAPVAWGATSVYGAPSEAIPPDEKADDKPPQAAADAQVSEEAPSDTFMADENVVSPVVKWPASKPQQTQDVPLVPTSLVKHESDSDPFEFEIDSWLTILRNMALELHSKGHGKGIVHLDLKPANFMIAQSGQVTLVDWGVAEYLKNNVKMLTKGTPPYVPVELWEVISGVKDDSQIFSTKQDIYSLARCFELLVFRRMNNLNPDAYLERCPVFFLPPMISVAATSPHLKKFNFDNPQNNPDLEAINALINLVHRMRGPQEQRPEATEVAAMLSEIRSKYRTTLTQVYEQEETTLNFTGTKATPAQPVQEAVSLSAAKNEAEVSLEETTLHLPVSKTEVHVFEHEETTLTLPITKDKTHVYQQEETTLHFPETKTITHVYQREEVETTLSLSPKDNKAPSKGLNDLEEKLSKARVSQVATQEKSAAPPAEKAKVLEKENVPVKTTENKVDLLGKAPNNVLFGANLVKEKEKGAKEKQAKEPGLTDVTNLPKSRGP